MPKIGEMSRPETTAACDTISDTFSGADGGIGYVKVMALIQRLDKAAVEGDKKADAVLECVRQFHRLINIAQR